VITSVAPSSVSSSDCSRSLTIHGAYFKEGARVAYESARPTCVAPVPSRGGAPTCELFVDSVTSTQITARFATCPTFADLSEDTPTSLPLVITNPTEVDANSDLTGGLETLTTVQLTD
jgi:hypothetical protein